MMHKKSYAFFIVLTLLIFTNLQPLSDVASASKQAESSAMQAQRDVERALAELKDLPPYGFALLEFVRNQTKYPTSLYFEKTVHDALPVDTVVRIKSLDPAQDGKYFSVRTNKKDNSVTFMADTTDITDDATKFTISRRISPNLHDWIGISHAAVQNKMMAVNLDNQLVVFDESEQTFNDEEGVISHWEIVGSDRIDKCTLRNRLTGKFFKNFSGMVSVKLEPDRYDIKSLTDMVALEASQFEILGAWLGSEDAIKKITANPQNAANIDQQIEVTDIIKDRALKTGKISLQPDMVNDLGVKDPAPSLTQQVGIQVGGQGNQQLDATMQQIKGAQDIVGKEKPKQFLLLIQEYGKTKAIIGADGKAFNYTIPAAVQAGGMFWYKTDAWRGEELTYNTIINIVNDSGNPMHYQADTSEYANCFVIQSKNNPLKQGPIQYKDEIVIRALWADGKICDIPQILVINDTGLSGVSADSPAAKKGDESFSITSPSGLTGTVCQYDSINIISNSSGAQQKALTYFYNTIIPQNATQATNQVFKIKAARFDPTVQAMYTRLGVKDYNQSPGKISQIAVRNQNEMWAINYKGDIFSWDGKRWSFVDTGPFISISVTQDGDKDDSAKGKSSTVYAVDANHIICSRKKQETGWTRIGSQKFKHVTAVDPDNVWGIGEDGLIYKLAPTGAAWDKTTPSDDVLIVTLSTSGSGDVWAVDSDGKIWNATQKTDFSYSWKTVDRPADKAIFKTIAVRNSKDAWATSTLNNTYQWDGSSWKRVSGNFGAIAVASGISKTLIPGKTEERQMQAVKADGAQDDPAAQIAFEIVQLGMGGNIAPASEVSCNVVVTKKPKVSGFAQTRIDQFPAGAKLVVVPLMSKGIAWPEASLAVPGRTTVSFVAQPEDQGDVQVVFGPNISDNWLYKVIIGGSGNTQAEIRQRVLDADGNPSENTLFKISKDQNPLAFAPPGVFTPYWVSFDKGFIMVGMGLPGENVFMAHQVQGTIGDINRVGFSSNKSTVNYAEIQFSPPVVTVKPTRTYAQSTATVTLNTGQQPTWSQTPFRIKDFGTTTLDIQGSDNVGLILGTTTSLTMPNYLVLFGAGNNEGISINKYDLEQKKYVSRAFLSTKSNPSVALDPTQTKRYWVSFHNGRFIIGLGDAGQKPVLVYQDLNALEGIGTVGFLSYSAQPAMVKNITASAQVNLAIEQQSASYRSDTSSDSFQGGVTIIIPFEYRFSQQDQAVLAEDLVNNMTFHPGGTPQQGTIYPFILTINPDGYPQLDWSKEPENKTVMKVQQAAVQAAAAVDLTQRQSEITASEGTRLKELQMHAADIQRAQFDAMTTTAKTLTGASGSVAMATGPEPITSAIALGTSIAFSVAGVTTSKLAESRLISASQEDFKGATVEAIQRKTSLDMQSIANRLQFSANLLSGQAQFAFRDPNSYVFVDAPARPSLGAASVPDEAVTNRSIADQLINQATYIKPVDQQTLETLMTALQNIVDRINNAYVVSDTLKKQFFKCIRGLYDGYNSLFANFLDLRIATDFLNLLTTAMNNSYLLDAYKDSSTRDLWYVWWNKLAHSILMKSPTITLQPAYGEYIWLPMPVKTPDQIVIEIDVEGQSDVFVCFAKGQDRVRNTATDLYEVVLGGWNNTKHAIRIQSLGQSVQEFTKDDYPDTMLLPYQSQTYRIINDNGRITIQCGDKTMSWKDPYPIQGVKYIGLSTWDMPITFKRIALKSLADLTKPLPKAESKAPVTTSAQKLKPKGTLKKITVTVPTQTPPPGLKKIGTTTKVKKITTGQNPKTTNTKPTR